MFFNILILAVFAAVAYFHYAQGLFSAFISTVIAAVAAVVAIGFHEQVFYAIGQGKMADVSLGAVLVALYAATYLALRLAMDSMVPGNVNFGSVGDQVGAGLLGIVAGLFTAGIIALAAQSMPFGTAIIGFSRFEAETRQVMMGAVPDWARVGRQDVTDHLFNNDELKVPAFVDGSQTPPLDPARSNGLWISGDTFVSNFVGRVSAGSLSADKSWLAVHPNFPNELFADRIGIQSGAKKTAFPLNKASQLDVVQVFKGPVGDKGSPGSFNLIDGDIAAFREKGEKIPDELKAGEGRTLVVVRMVFKQDAAEKDNFVRFSPGSIRLVAGGKDYYPIGFLKDEETVTYQHPDDFMFVGGGQGVDAVFAVDPDAFYGGPADAATKVAPDVFVEFKRMSVAQIGGRELKSADDLPTDDDDTAKYRTSILRRDTWAKPEGEATPKKKTGKKK